MRHVTLVVSALALIACSGVMDSLAEQAESNPEFQKQFRESFKTSFVTSCAKEPAQTMGEPAARALCSCMGDRLLDAHSAKDLLAMMQNAEGPAFEAEMTQLTEACLAATPPAANAPPN